MLNATSIIKALLDANKGYLLGKRYCIDDDTLYEIKGNECIEVTYLDELSQVVFTEDSIEFWEDDCCVRITHPTIKEINKELEILVEKQYKRMEENEKILEDLKKINEDISERVANR